jgi:predicted heme/steroid binding protein
MIKINRFAAWILFFVIIAYAITGYGMTKGLIDANFARTWHLGWLGLVGLIVFVVHTFWGIHLFLRRKNIWNILTKIILFGFFIGLVSFFVYMQFFYGTNNYNNNSSFLVTGATGDILQVYNAETLKPYNGLNGQPAYVAVNGLVYDMSREFINGEHYGYSAGQDLSQSFRAKHPNSFLKKVSVVGTYQDIKITK